MFYVDNIVFIFGKGAKKCRFWLEEILAYFFIFGKTNLKAMEKFLPQSSGGDIFNLVPESAIGWRPIQRDMRKHI